MNNYRVQPGDIVAMDMRAVWEEEHMVQGTGGHSKILLLLQAWCTCVSIIGLIAFSFLSCLPQNHEESKGWRGFPRGLFTAAAAARKLALWWPLVLLHTVFGHHGSCCHSPRAISATSTDICILGSFLLFSSLLNNSPLLNKLAFFWIWWVIFLDEIMMVMIIISRVYECLTWIVSFNPYNNLFLGEQFGPFITDGEHEMWGG